MSGNNTESQEVKVLDEIPTPNVEYGLRHLKQNNADFIGPLPENQVENTKKQVDSILEQLNYHKDYKIFSEILGKLYQSFICLIGKNDIHCTNSCEKCDFSQLDISALLSSEKFSYLLKHLIQVFEELKKYKTSNVENKENFINDLVETFNTIYISILSILKQVDLKSNFLLSPELLQDYPMVEFYMTFDENGKKKIDKVSENVMSLLGYQSSEFETGNITFKDLIHPKDKSHISTELEEHLKKGDKIFVQKYRLISKNGKSLDVYDKKTVLYDENGKPKIIYGFIYDNESSYKDKKGIPNKKSLNRDIENLPEDVPVNLFLVKIRNLDFLNSSFGRTFGDKVIELFFIKLKESFSQDDIYQISSSEFAILTFPNTKLLKNIEKYVDGYFQKLNDFEIVLEGVKINLNISLGTSLINKENILSNAQIALESSKIGNKPVIFRKELEIKSKEDNQKYLEWQIKIKNGIKEGKFIPYYQGIKDNNSDEPISKFESLIRYKSEDGQIVSPGIFLDIAKKSPFINSLTELMIEKVILNMSTNPNFSFSLNLSIEDLKNERIIKFIESRILIYKIDPSKLIIEVLEEESMNSEDAFEKILELKELGIQIAIDDFGVGSSNFKRLLQLKPDYIKIDGFFIEDLETSDEKRMIVKQIVELAKMMGSKTIAEFVKNENIYKIVKELGIDYSQGYYFSVPNSIPLGNQ